MEQKKDIQSRQDLDQLVRAFYDKLLVDPLLAPLFLEVAKIDLDAHFPILVDFWESVLFQTGSYRRNTLAAHMDLHRKHPLEAAHFKRWLELFDQSVDEGFAGEKARLAKERALSIAFVIQVKIEQEGKGFSTL